LTLPSQIPIFLFYLVNSLGQSYYIDAAGNLQKSGIPRPINYSPDGWQEMTIGWERVIQKFGLIRNFSLTLGFLGDAALILEKLSYEKNPDERVWLLVQKVEVTLTDIDYAVEHKFYYKGEIDLSTVRHSRRKVLVNIMEGGRAQDIAANQSTTYTIPIADNARKIRVFMDGFPLSCKFNCSFYQDFAPKGIHLAPTAFLTGEGTQLSLAHADSVTAVNVGAGYYGSSQDWFLHGVDQPTVVRIRGQVRILPLGDIPHNYSLGIRLSDGSSTVLVPFQTINTPTKTFAFDVTFTIPAGMDAYWEGNWEGDLDLAYGESKFTVEFLNTYKSTFIYVLKPLDMYKELIRNMSGDEAFAVSSLLEASGICVTSGDAIRGLAKAAAKLSFKTYTDSWSVLKCAGIGVENGNIVLERRSHFLRDDLLVDLGEIKDRENSYAVDIMFNLLRYGYEDQRYQDVNGRFEFNCLFERSTPIKKVTKILELISQIRADPYGIEFTRINFDGKTTTDSGSDNDVFFLNVDLDNPQADADGTYYNLKRVAYTNIEGFADPSIGPEMFNIEELTPDRILSEWKQYFAGCFAGYNGLLTITNVSKNRDLKTEGGPGGTFDEDADLDIANLGAALFGNWKHTFTAVCRSNLVKALTATPYAAFQFSEAGQSFKGFLMKGSIKSKTNQEQQFILLTHPDNDLTKFENG
jgi:hypothetical protein